MKMTEKSENAYLMSLIGGILMLVNGLLAGLNKGTIIVSTYAVSSPQEILNSTAPFWARVSFGSRGWIEGLWIPISLILASLVVFCSIMFYIQPIRRKILGFLIVLFSILGILFGGGFILGSLLGIIGGAISFEWPKPPKETFFGKIIRAARLDSTVYKSLEEDPHALRKAAYTIILVNVLSGLGCGLYAYTTEKILSAQSLTIPFRILMLGELFLDVSILTPAIINIVMAVLKWITLSIIFYVIGVLIVGGKTSLEKIMVAVAFAYVPISLQLFMPFVMFSRPYLIFSWPFAVFLVTNIWVILAIIVAIRQTLGISLGKVIGTVSLAGASYLFINQQFFMKLDIPYSIRFFFQPEPVFLMTLACLVALATLFGVFTRTR